MVTIARRILAKVEYLAEFRERRARRAYAMVVLHNIEARRWGA